MSTRFTWPGILLLTGMALLWPAASAQAQPGGSKNSALLMEPGTFSVEDLVVKPLKVKVRTDAPIYYHATMDRVLGSMAPGTVVTLVAMSDTAYRVRGKARHGDVAGWMWPQDLVLPTPDLAANLKKAHERNKQVQELIDNHLVALGMTKDEVESSLGKPTRRSSKVTAAGREDKLEYAVFERVPQVTTMRGPYGNLVQSTVYVKVEVGTLAVSFKDDIVEAVEETKGNPLGGGSIKIVPGPIMVW